MIKGISSVAYIVLWRYFISFHFLLLLIINHNKQVPQMETALAYFILMEAIIAWKTHDLWN